MCWKAKRRWSPMQVKRCSVPGMCAGFKAGTGDAHHLQNRTQGDVVFLEVGDRSPEDSVTYPDDDVIAVYGSDGKWKYSRKDGTPY